MYVGVRVRGGVGIPGGRFPHALRVCVWPSEPMEAESRALRPSVGREPSPRGPSPTRAGPCLFDCAVTAVASEKRFGKRSSRSRNREQYCT